MSPKASKCSGCDNLLFVHNTHEDDKDVFEFEAFSELPTDLVRS
jgi:sulfur transfer protein SufE